MWHDYLTFLKEFVEKFDVSSALMEGVNISTAWHEGVPGYVHGACSSTGSMICVARCLGILFWHT